MATASKEPGCLILFREKTRGSQNQIRLWPGALRSHHSFCSVPQKPPPKQGALALSPLPWARAAGAQQVGGRGNRPLRGSGLLTPGSLTSTAVCLFPGQGLGQPEPSPLLQLLPRDQGATSAGLLVQAPLNAALATGCSSAPPGKRTLRLQGRRPLFS